VRASGGSIRRGETPPALYGSDLGAGGDGSFLRGVPARNPARIAARTAPRLGSLAPHRQANGPRPPRDPWPPQLFDDCPFACPVTGLSSRGA
jgi:hypothetical protein